jgi:hypothetical protein
MSQLLLETQIDLDDDTQPLPGSQPETISLPDDDNSQLLHGTQVADSQLLPDTQVADSQLLPDTQVADSQLLPDIQVAVSQHLPDTKVADSQLLADTQAADSQLLPKSCESTADEVNVEESSQVKKRPRIDDYPMKFQGVMNMVCSMLEY